MESETRIKCCWMIKYFVYEERYDIQTVWGLLAMRRGDECCDVQGYICQIYCQLFINHADAFQLIIDDELGCFSLVLQVQDTDLVKVGIYCLYFMLNSCEDEQKRDCLIVKLEKMDIVKQISQLTFSDNKDIEMFSTHLFSKYFQGREESDLL